MTTTSPPGMRTLLDLLPRIRNLGKREAIRYCSEFRTRQLSYQDLYYGIGAVAHQLDRLGLQRGDRLLLWGENRPEWLMVFWACLARGVQVVPLDVQSSVSFADRIHQQVKARLLVHDGGINGTALSLPAVSFQEIRLWPRKDPGPSCQVSPSTIAEIVFTSGTTAEPRGVIHRHRNICANLRGVEMEIARYRRLAGPFQPLRILNMLPLSHMYGQALGAFIPLLLGGSVVFTALHNPAAILRTIGRERVTALVTVPAQARTLLHQLRRSVELAAPGVTATGRLTPVRRWWRYRRIHRALGWKFWAIVIGGARLDSRVEAAWKELGFVVVQGYGLTETSPMVTATHPAKGRAGSIGKPLKGLEVRIAPDGEILLRGESISDEYLGSPPGGRTSPEGWFHTGDMGEMDKDGWLFFRGRRQDLIVTPEGLNVFPHDIEPVLNSHPEIRDSVVLAVSNGDEERVHAVLIPSRPGADLERVVTEVNRQLETHQQIRGWSIWPDQDFPRTPSTLKVQRQRIAKQLSGKQMVGPSRIDSLEQILSHRVKNASQPADNHRLDEELGLSSLDQVDLLSRLEEHLGVELEEEEFTQISTVGELKTWLQGVTPEGYPGLEQEPIEVPGGWHQSPPAPPGWSRWRAMELLRRVVLNAGVLPLFRRYIRLTPRGQEHLSELCPPVIFAANHVSHLDTLAVLGALPKAWRKRLSPAMSWDYFLDHSQAGRGWARRLKMSGQYYTACTLLQAYPISQNREGLRRTLRYSGRLMDQGRCPLLYPEGRRSPHGRLLPFQSGVGYMALRLEAPVVPIYLEGMYEIYSIHHDWPDSGEVRVRIGPALHFDCGRDYLGATRSIEKAFRRLQMEG